MPACPDDQSQLFDGCFGAYDSPNGDRYVGEWKNDEPHGIGTATYADGDRYAGEFNQGAKHGRGVYTFADGEEYSGDVVDNEYHGRGTYTFADGERYVGDFENGVRHGWGAWYAADGTVLEEGYWENDELVRAESVETSDEGRGAPADIVPAASGTGFFVSTDGHIVTNNHVIEGCTEVVAHHEGNEYRSTVLSTDPINDLALLQSEFRPDAPLRLSRSNPFLLQDIFVAGFPFGRSFSSSVKVTRGVVSSLTGLGDNFSEMQIDAALQPGNSGGPIVDDTGSVVGIAVAKLDVKATIENWGTIPENTNFGIKSTVVETFLQGNSVDYARGSGASIAKRELAKMISDNTLYLSCWMTTAQIERMRSERVMFTDLN